MNDKRKLLGILVIGLFFLTFAYKLGFIWAHDHDLYAWIAKDIIVNHHWRLVGQVTSVDGVFIGGFYYYLMAFMFWLFKMNPISAIFATSIIGLVSIWSIYFVIKDVFSDMKNKILNQKGTENKKILFLIELDTFLLLNSAKQRYSIFIS